MLLAILLGCQGSTPATVVTSSGVVVSGETYSARADSAWAAVGSVTLSPGGRDYIAKVNTAVAVDVPGKLQGLPEGAKVVDLRTSPARAALEGTDEKAAAEAVRAAGAKILVVHTGTRASFDRTSVVLSRLVHHDELRWFQLARVEDGALVYLVTDGQLAFPPELAAPATAWVRATLSGANPSPFPSVKPERSDFQIITSIRRQGHELAVSLATCGTLDKCLSENATELEAFHRRNREPLGLPKLADDMANIVIEIHRVTEKAYVVPRDDAPLRDLWEMGLDGALIIDQPSADEKASGKKASTAVWPGAVAANRSYTHPDQFLKALAREFRMDSVRPWRDDGNDLYLLRTTHYMEQRDASLIPLYRGVPPVPMDFVNLTTARDSVVYAGEWYLANLKPDGVVTYKYWPEENRYSNEYNHVRHTLATWNLWQAWQLDPRPEFLEGANRATRWTMSTLVERDGTNLPAWEREKVEASPLRDEILKEGMAYFTFANNTKLGSVVVHLMGALAVAKSTNDHSQDEIFRKLGRYVLFSNLPDGSWDAYHVPPGHPADDDKNDIVPGEAALALVYLYEYFGDERYLEPLPKFFEYYKPWFRQRSARKKPGAPWPAFTYTNQDRLDMVQFGPWSVMAANAYTRVRPQETEVAEFGFEVAKWMIDSYEYTEANSPFPDYVGGYYKFEGELPAMQAFCYGEGTAAAYQMALRMKPELAPYFEKHTRETVRIAMQMQHHGLSVYPYSRPDEVKGGIKYALNEPKVRIDYVHHALSTVYQWLEGARVDPNLPESARREPDAMMREMMRRMDFPSARAPGTPVRTSVPASTGSVHVLEVVDESDGGGE